MTYSIQLIPTPGENVPASPLLPFATLCSEENSRRFDLTWTELSTLSRPGEHPLFRRTANEANADAPVFVRTSSSGELMEWHFRPSLNIEPAVLETALFREQARSCLQTAKQTLVAEGPVRTVPEGFSLMDFLFMDLPGTPPRLKVVSGGQTGVDRAALEAALSNGLDCCGWCPCGRRAEDGRIPSRYPMMETQSTCYPERTRRNILASDGTLILNTGPGPVDGGTKYTLKLIKELSEQRRRRIPTLLVQLDGLWASPSQAIHWIMENDITRLNVAGPRESKSPGITRTSRDFLETVFKAFLPPAV